MRHRKAGYKLGRTTAHRASTLRNLAAGLFEHGQITTTITRAKAMQPMVEKIVTLAKRGDVHSRRLVAAKLGHDRKAFEWLYVGKRDSEEQRSQVARVAERAQAFFNIPDASTVEKNRYGEVRKSPRLVKHIFENVAPRFKDRAGGYTRIVKLGRFRVGDAGELCIIQFVGTEEGPEIGGNLSRRRRAADKRTAFAKKVREGFASKKAD
jgi:large subunit ribosomal protein L17